MEIYPLAAKAVLEHCYMDDLMPSVPTVDEAKETRRQLTELGDQAGFHIRKWVSNDVDVIADIKEEDRASEIDLEKRELPTTKTLGVLWSATDDRFFFRHSLQLDGFEFTKRNVLKKTATVYDPLGFLSPYIVRSKLLMQKAWLEAGTWDDLLPEYHQQEWIKWFQELNDLELVKIPRCLKDPVAKVVELSIHTFTDASESAYAAVVYARHVYESAEVTVRLFASKSRLAPLKAVSIPRLELEDAEEAIIREVQTEKYAAEMDALRRNKQISRQSTLAPLNPVLVNGILRSNTRLQQADNLPYEVKCQIILPERNQVTGLIVKYYRESEGHQMGLNYTINHLRERYFVVHTREQVKRVMRECLECAKRFRSRPACQQMAPLPRIRLQQSSRPFINCAVDFGGPYLTKQGRGRVRAKRYLCLFLCLQTHCCHLELVSSLDTYTFLNAFIRMTARRGWPKQMLSNNGTNFVSSSREIKELVSAIDQDKVQRMTSNKGVTWKWNPPAAPHFGGVFESMIKSAKRAIAAVLGDVVQR